MSQGKRLLLALLLIATPLAAPLYVLNAGMKNAPLDALRGIAAILLLSLILVVAAALIARPVMVVDPIRLKRAAAANLAFIVLDAAIFGLLVYEQHFSVHACRGPGCDLYPLGWISLAGMHACWVVVICLLIPRAEGWLR